MGKEALAKAKSHISTALDELEDIVNEAQETHHIFISQTTGLRRTLKAIEVNLQVAERNEQPL